MRPVREAIVLAGGFGTRLAHVVPDVCKPMALVAGRPFLRYVLDHLAEYKFDKVVIADGYRREQIESFFGNFYRGMDVVYSTEDEPLLTGGAVKKALGQCSQDWVFVLNGDTYIDVDFSALERTACSADAHIRAVMAVKTMRDFNRYGTVELDASGRIVAFNEKAPCSVGKINAGVYYLRNDALRDMPDKFSLEHDFFEAQVSRGILATTDVKGDFIDIGVPEDYERAQVLLEPLARSWRLALFDRDGTINVDTGHLFEPEKLDLISRTIDILRRYSNDPDYKVVVVTNQAGIAKGMYTKRDVQKLHRVLDEQLARLECRIDAYYYCPHHPDYTGDCECRKPKPGMLLSAIKDYDAVASECIMFGNDAKDQAAAKSACVDFRYVEAV